jgi:catechol 2,3-dioxygenase-like lactoylglutathione lyase family enzyme
MLSPPPLPSKRTGTDFDEDSRTFQAPIGGETSSDLHEGKSERGRKHHLCISAADENAVRFAIARMEADNNHNDQTS